MKQTTLYKSEQHNRLTAVRDLGMKPRANGLRNEHMVLWYCACGKEVELPLTRVRTGGYKSCGCSFKLQFAPGDHYGRLTILREVAHRHYPHSTIRRVETKCDCGKITIKSLQNVINGLVKSCGCLQAEHQKRHGKSLRIAEGQAAFNCLYSMYTHSAKHRNLEFSISKDNFRTLTSSKCFYCDLPPEQKLERQGMHGCYVYNGIDRIDNDIGYLAENCVACCGQCNRAKNTLSRVDFEHWIDRLVLKRIKHD